MKNKNKFVVFDANSVIHRAYHALPPLTTKKGQLVNAVYGFLLVFFKTIREFQPDFVAAAFDFPAPTFRHKKYKEYKAKRPPAPPELYQQIPKVKEILSVFGTVFFEKEGFEADDIIGTITRLIPKKQPYPEIEIVIVSGDMDTVQLITPETKVFTLKKGVKDTFLYDEKLVKEKFQGLKPNQLLDYKALRGDPSDNIPGITGIGEKTTLNLLQKFGSLENLYNEIKEKSEKSKNLNPKTKETLLKYKEQAFLSKELAEINRNVPIDFTLQKCRWGDYDKEKAVKILKNLNFYSLINRLPQKQEKFREGRKKPKESKKNDLIGENLRLW